MLDKADDAAKKAIDMLKDIKTLEDMREHKDDLLDLMEESVKDAVETLRAVVKMDHSQLNEEMARIQSSQEERTVLGAQLESELERIANLPGAGEYMEELRDEMEDRMEPYSLELAELMGEIMGALMSGMMEGGFGDLMGNALAQMGYDFNDEDEEEDSGEEEQDEDEEDSGEEEQVEE